MNGKIAAITIIGIFFLSIFIIPTAESSLIASTSSGNTLYVGGSGPGNYSIIQNAVNDANPGDTIFFYPGVYNVALGESGTISNAGVFIDKSISLISENKAHVTINTTDNVVGIHVEADDVLISGFTFKSEKSDSIWINGGSATICYNDFIGNRGSVSLTNNELTTVEHNTFEFNTAGIIVCNSSGVVQNNIIKNNYEGISLHGEIGITIKNNLISFNEHDGINLGDFLTANNNIIVNNDIKRNGLAGIHISGSNNYISGNQITKNKIGIEFRESAGFITSNNNIISKNNITYNEITGLYLDGSNNSIIENNFIDNKAHFKAYTFFNKNLKNVWQSNYWGRARLLPYIINGRVEIFPLPSIRWINIDRHPAAEPFDIEV